MAFTFPGRRAIDLEGMNGLSGGCVRRTFGALAGYGVRIPRPSPGVRAPASDANSGLCVALAEVWRTLRPPQCPTSRPCARDVFTSSPHRGPDRSPVGGCGPVWYVRGDNLQLQTVTDARGAQTPPETVYRARKPGPGAVITALRADTATGDGVPILCTLASNPKQQR